MSDITLGLIVVHSIWGVHGLLGSNGAFILFPEV